jgi:hypothetical protein
MWTCHNIEEHNFSSTGQNDRLRKWLAVHAACIIIFHEDLKEFLPVSAADKVVVASFGDMQSFVEGQVKTNSDFKSILRGWKNKNDGPYLLSVSAAKKNNLQLAVDGVQLAEIAALLLRMWIHPVELKRVIFFFTIKIL